jgi:phosphomannomutase
MFQILHFIVLLIIVGTFIYYQKDKIVDNCKNGNYKSFDNYSIARVEDLDGYKFYIDDNTWIMVRASGTEPVLRVYVQAPDTNSVSSILEAAKKALLQ